MIIAPNYHRQRPNSLTLAFISTLTIFILSNSLLTTTSSPSIGAFAVNTKSSITMTQSNPNSMISEKTSTSEDGAAHSSVTLQLSKRESSEHSHGMDEAYAHMRLRDLIVKAYALNDTSAPSVSQANVKVVHFARHGQGFHNLMADLALAAGKEWKNFVRSPDNPYIMTEILDAPLTHKGRLQAMALQTLIRDAEEQPELVVLSTNCRALQTGVIAFGHLLEDNGETGGKVPFLAHEMVREEAGVHACDQRRPISQQKREFPMVDFSLVETDEDTIFTSDHRETKMEVANRVYKFMEWLEKRPEKHVAVASHSGWLMTVFNGILECDESLKSWFQTGEMRSVKLVFTKKE